MRQCWDRMDGYMSLNRIAWLAFIGKRRAITTAAFD
jgi:hypothetical protein